MSWALATLRAIGSWVRPSTSSLCVSCEEALRDAPMLYFSLLPSIIRAHVDRLLVLNSWSYAPRFIPVIDMNSNIQCGALSSGETFLLYSWGGFPASTFIVMEPETPRRRNVGLVGRLERVLTCENGDPCLILSNEIQQNVTVSIYTIEGKLLAECDLRSSISRVYPELAQQEGKITVASPLSCARWVLMGPVLYHLPLLTESVPVPFNCHNSLWRWSWCVWGEYGKELLAAYSQANNELNPIQVWNLRTRELLVTTRCTTYPPSWNFFAEAEVAESSYHYTGGGERVYISLRDGSVLTQHHGDFSTDHPLDASDRVQIWRRSQLIVHKMAEGRAYIYNLKHSQCVCMYHGRYVIVCGPKSASILAKFFAILNPLVISLAEADSNSYSGCCLDSNTLYFITYSIATNFSEVYSIRLNDKEQTRNYLGFVPSAITSLLVPVTDGFGTPVILADRKILYVIERSPIPRALCVLPLK